MDIDFLVAEYDRSITRALVEYKGEGADPQSLQLDNPGIKTIAKLATDTSVPAFLVQYAEDFSWWRAEPLNDAGYVWVPRRRTMTEYEYVSLLYKLRGRIIPNYVAERLRRDNR